MKRSFTILFLFMCCLLLLLSWIWGVTVSAKFDGEVEISNPVFISDQGWITSNRGQLISTYVYTLYLPLVIKSPLNPKKGIDIKAPPACSDLEALRASWYLNWYPFPDSTCSSSYSKNFVPRITGRWAMPYLSEAVTHADASGWLIGFGEPNRPDQENMSPVEGATLWKKIQDAADEAGIKLVSPSPYEPDPVYGHNWLWDMVDAYQTMYGEKPRFDAMGWNIYGCTNHPLCHDVEEMKNYLRNRRSEALAREYNGQIWVLEFGGCVTENSFASDRVIMREMSSWFDQTPWIERYAWYSNRRASSYQGDHDCVLINEDNSLTELGKIYRDF